MKKVFRLLMFTAAFMFACNVTLLAQDDQTTAGSDTTTTETVAQPEPAPISTVNDDVVEEEKSFHQILKEKFIEGGATFMTPVLICLILGLAISIERIISLNLATTNIAKLLNKIEDALKSGGVEEAKRVAAATKGPVASIITQGLMRNEEGIEVVEKSVVAYGSLEMSRLEKGLVWISLFIALAPMLGFMGTVIGMIGAFDSIEAAGDISPSLVAGGIKVALLTTVFGLIVAIILQIMYNYCVSKIDSIVGELEEASISLVDLLVKYQR
jgi:biopolymer transport protein ExbB